ncbi:MAG: hypothetical protein IKN12_05315 [Selenomonadaceae bacterium]|nr:hypothetical protein [Selenomonadaceae bacterium]
MDDYKLRNVATKYSVSKEAILNIVKRLDLLSKNLVYIEYDKNDNKQYMFKEEAINAIRKHLLRNPNKIYGKKTMAAECNTTEYKLYSIMDKFGLIDDDHIIIRKNVRGKDLYIFDDILVDMIKNYIEKEIFPKYPSEEDLGENIPAASIPVPADVDDNEIFFFPSDYEDNIFFEVDKNLPEEFLNKVDTNKVTKEEKQKLYKEETEFCEMVSQDLDEASFLGSDSVLKQDEKENIDIHSTAENAPTDFSAFKEKYEKQYAKNNLYGCFETVDGKLKRTLDPQLFIDTVFLYFSDVDKIVEKYNEIKAGNDKYEKFLANIRREIDEENVSLETPEKYVLLDGKSFDELTDKYADKILNGEDTPKRLPQTICGISVSTIVLVWLTVLTILFIIIIMKL